MNDKTTRPHLLDIPKLVVKESPRDHFFAELAVTDSSGALLGYAQQAGRRALLVLSTMSDGFFFPSRPIDVRDQDGQPVLQIEFRGILRRRVVTVRRSDRSVLGTIVGKTWATTVRNKGYSVDVAGEHVGEIVVEKREYRMLDTSGVQLARIEKRGGERTSQVVGTETSRVTTMQAHQRLSEPLAALALAATIQRHRT